MVVGVEPVKGEIKSLEIKREKISEQANESGIQPVDKGGAVTALATTSAEKETTIVSADEPISPKIKPPGHGLDRRQVLVQMNF
ncbi:MAG: hypothetical protein GDA43_18060 [Hormoscilla sp. SP5CHS1]|nr:hypothetical protein [Hormoscilla sp. SP5CHS1]